MKSKHLLLIPALLLVFLFAGCKKELDKPQPGVANSADLKGTTSYKLMVASDFHYFSHDLLDPNPNTLYQAYLMAHPYMLSPSPEIFKRFVYFANLEKPDLLIIPGDMTKDGEMLNHQELIYKMQQLLLPSIKVLVIPGNHDLDNVESVKYVPVNQSEPRMSLKKSQFAGLYSACGPGAAISRDPVSCSYVVEPFKNFRVIMIDATKLNKPFCETSGAIQPQTLRWLKGVLNTISLNHMQAIAVMHHQLVPHYTAELATTPGYVIDNWKSVADQLIAAGLKVILTGHFHGNDVTQYNNLYDVGTGSLVTWPVPYRILQVDRNKILISTKYVRGISISGQPIEVHALNGLKNYYIAYFTQRYTQLGVPVPAILPLAQVTADAFLAHLDGDERISASNKIKLADALEFITNPVLKSKVSQLVMNFYTDLPPQDLTLRINMQ